MVVFVRYCYLSMEDVEVFFGVGYELIKKLDLF